MANSPESGRADELARDGGAMVYVSPLRKPRGCCHGLLGNHEVDRVAKVARVLVI